MPPPGVTIVRGMTTNIEDEEGYGYSEIATLGSKIVYAGYYNDPNHTVNGVSGQNVVDLGLLGALDTGSATAKETKLGGIPIAIRVAPNGTVFFVEDIAYDYTIGQPVPNDGSGVGVYVVGAADSNGNLLYEKTFTSLGIPSTNYPYPADMALAPDGSAMYIANYCDCSAYQIIKIPIGGTTLGTASFANIAGNFYLYTIAADSDGNVVTFSGNDNEYNYDWSYVPAASFLSSSLVTQPFTATVYTYSYSLAYGDGSYWAADYEYGGIMWIANVGKGTTMDYITNNSYPDSSKDLCGVMFASGAVWGGDCDYGGFFRVAYGAPPQNGVQGLARIRVTSSAPKTSSFRMPRTLASKGRTHLHAFTKNRQARIAHPVRPALRGGEAAVGLRGGGFAVGVDHVLADHPFGREVRAVERDREAHHLGEAFGFVVVHRDDAFELLVERRRVGVGAAVDGADGPTGLALDAAFDPPAVENREARDAVQRGLHPARPRGFLGTAGPAVSRTTCRSSRRKPRRSRAPAPASRRGRGGSPLCRGRRAGAPSRRRRSAPDRARTRSCAAARGR
jgi:hypothetical protein